MPLLVILLFAAAATTQDHDPVIGAWELDVAKSSFDPGPPLKSQRRVYEETASGVKFTLTGISAAGRPMRVEYTAPYDGRDYPLNGSPSVNSVALTRIDRLHVDAVEKKDGTPKFHVTRVISPDENTMTVTSIGTNAKGTKIKNVLFFRRVRGGGA
jgi:hypothetical protein